MGWLLRVIHVGSIAPAIPMGGNQPKALSWRGVAICLLVPKDRPSKPTTIQLNQGVPGSRKQGENKNQVGEKSSLAEP
jgi:hypothetical protein